jgi:RNA-directed DNA polymerase
LSDGFVILVNGSGAHAKAQWDEVGEVLSEVGLRLAPEKKRVVHNDEGFDFLGFRIRRY